MYINNIKELNGCLRDSIPCKFLIGSFYKKPYIIQCSMGNKCCRGYCCFHLDDNSKRAEEIKELIKIESEVNII